MALEQDKYGRIGFDELDTELFMSSLSAGQISIIKTLLMFYSDRIDKLISAFSSYENEHFSHDEVMRDAAKYFSTVIIEE